MKEPVMTTPLSNNRVELIGTIVSNYTFSHEVFGEGFYTMKMEIKRNSGNVDTIPCMISNRLADISINPIGCRVKIQGQFRSFNQYENGKSHLLLNVFVQEIEELEDSNTRDKNELELYGFLCKRPQYRVTPLGYEITDCLLAVNRPYGKSDYIPCICWGRNAKFTSTQLIGEKVHIKGRIQSRVYYKQEADSVKKKQPHIAYEVSISSIQEVTEN